ncbi:unnamed protein product, partial [Symbiodinium microadriaticum]
RSDCLSRVGRLSDGYDKPPGISVILAACDKSHAKRYPTETDAAKSTTGPEKKWFEVSGTSLEPGDKSSMVRHQREVLSYPDVQMQSVKACAGRA